MPGRQNLPTIANLIERLTSIPVTVAPDALMAQSQFAPGQDINAEAAPVAPKMGQAKTQAAKQQAVANAVQKAGGPQQWVSPKETEPGLELNYQGSLAGLLDLVALHNDLQWMYANGKIHFYRVVTRNLLVKTLPANGTMPSVGGGAGAEGTTAGALDVLAGVEKTLRGMMSRHGRMQLDASLGSITVSDSFINVQAMERHLDSINRQLGRQVALTVEVLQITLSNENQSGIDWNFVTNTAKLGTLSFNGPPALPTSSGSIGLVKSGDSENFLLLRALEKFGRVSTSYSSVITTMNRQAVPLCSVSTQSYLKQSTPSITTSATGLAVVGQAGLTPGEIVTGFTLNLLPIVLDSNHVLIECGLSLSSLKSLTSFNSGSGASLQTIQQPSIANFGVLQRLVARGGETIVLSGFDAEALNSEQVDPLVQRLPGSRKGSNERTTTVVLITPRLIDQ
jgi:type II secretory pathway component GspD/PulD (secretin)